MTALALLLLAAAPDAGASPSLKVEGDLVKNASLSLEELQALGPVRVEWLDTHPPRKAGNACAAPAQPSDKGCLHKLTGVRLDEVLLRLGFSEGPMGPQVNPKEKHQGLRAVVVATAPDGFEAVFSLGEVLRTLGATTALVVWEMDGKPLPPDVGPLRIVVLTDKGLSRSIHQLASLRVIDLKKR